MFGGWARLQIAQLVERGIVGNFCLSVSLPKSLVRFRLWRIYVLVISIIAKIYDLPLLVIYQEL